MMGKGGRRREVGGEKIKGVREEVKGGKEEGGMAAFYIKGTSG